MRFEVLWYKPDLEAVGFKQKYLDTVKCVDSQRAIEVTPVAIRAASGHDFRIDTGRQNVTTIEPGRVRLFFHKVTKGGAAAIASILKHGLWRNCGIRTEAFFSGRFPHDDKYLCAINNTEDRKFQCHRSDEIVNMDCCYIHQPFVKGTWVLVDAEKWQGEGNQAHWNMTTNHPTTKTVVAPKFIIATFRGNQGPPDLEARKMGSHNEFGSQRNRSF